MAHIRKAKMRGMLSAFANHRAIHDCFKLWYDMKQEWQCTNIFDLDEYQCTNLGCDWKLFEDTIDWGYYDKSIGDCVTCHTRCSSDRNCQAFECGTSYCSWWKPGTCDYLSNATMSNTKHETCRKKGNIHFNTLHKEGHYFSLCLE